MYRQNTLEGFVLMLRIGHRGAGGYEPENTLRSFNRALQLGVDMIELDVHVCQSGEIVVIHDDRVDRTTNGTGYVADTTLDQLRILDAGRGEKIPTLREVLEMVNRKSQVNIELKGTGTAKPVFQLLEKYVTESGWIYSDFLISSFNHDELQEFGRLGKEFNLGVLGTGADAGFIEFAEEIGAYSINVYLRFITSELVDIARRKSIKVFVWTVDDIAEIERIRSMGVDGIFSNYPDRL